jgi:hypothetical protein
MFNQTFELIEEIKRIQKENNISKFHLVGFSQGALMSRSILSLMDNHECQNFLSIAGPQAGVFGLHIFDNVIPIIGRMFRIFLDYMTPSLITRSVHLLIYTEMFQNLFSFSGYWHDPGNEME